MSPPTPLPTYIYKILPSAPPEPLPVTLPLSPLDAKDGFIHLSTAEQTPLTVSRFFANDEAVWILKIALATLESGDGEVRWEESGSGGVFAHLYGGHGIGSAEVERVLKVERGSRGWEGVDWKGTL